MPILIEQLVALVVGLFGAWTIVRFTAVGLGPRLRDVDDELHPPEPRDLAAWRAAVRRELGGRWVGSRSPLGAASPTVDGPTAAEGPATDERPGIHLIVGRPGAGSSVLLWRTLQALLADPAAPLPLLVEAVRWASFRPEGPAWGGWPATRDRLLLDAFIAAELQRLTAMPRPVSEQLADEVVLLVDGFDELLALDPDAAEGFLAALSAPPWPGAAPGAASGTRRVIVSTTPDTLAGLTAAGVSDDTGPVVSITHLEPAMTATVRRTVAGAEPPCPGLVAALDRLPALETVLGHPLWLDLALDVYRSPGGESALDHLPATATSETITDALWSRWLDRRVVPGSDERRHLAALAQRQPPHRLPTFHPDDLARGHGGPPRAWTAAVTEGASVGTAFALLAGTPLAVGAWRTTLLWIVVGALAASILAAWILGHARPTASMVRSPPAGSGISAGPARFGLLAWLILVTLIVTSSPVGGIPALGRMIAATYTLPITVPAGVVAGLAFRTRLGGAGRVAGLVTLAAIGGLVELLMVLLVTSIGYLDGGLSHPNPAPVIAWWSGGLIAGTVVGLVDGLLPWGPGPARFSLGRFVRSLGRTARFWIVAPAALWLTIGALYNGDGAILSFLLALVAPGVTVVTVSGWLVSAAAGALVSDPERVSSPEPARSAADTRQRVAQRVAVALPVLTLVAVPAGWALGLVLGQVELGPVSPPSVNRARVPMVGPVTTGVLVATGLWLVATMAGNPAARGRLALAWAARRGRVPHNVPGFLDRLVARGVLHPSGAGYRFRHPTLADHLATVSAGGSTTGPSTEPGQHAA